MKLNITPTLFNEIFKETMDSSGLKGNELAKLAGRSTNNISRIRQGKDFPSIKDFMELIAIAEEVQPGFFEDFARRLIGESRRLTVSPEELIEALDSSEFGALMIAAGRRMCESGTQKGDAPAYQKIAS